MQTKILLSVLAILSISFIGLARPGNSSGSHAEAGSLTDTTVTAPVDSHETPIVSQDQDKKEQKKGVKKKVKKEDKEKEKTILVWTAKEGEKGTYEIIIDKDDPKKIIFVTSPHAEHDKDTKAYWTIKSDKLHFSEDVKTIKLDKGAVIHIKKVILKESRLSNLTQIISLLMSTCLPMSRCIPKSMSLSIQRSMQN